MNKLMIATVLVAMTSTAALADGLTALGLDDPEVMAPPSASGDWDGPYVGLSYGRVSSLTSVTSYTEQCFKFDDVAGERFSDELKDCATYVPPPGYSLERVQVPGETITTDTTSDEFGAFAGYRVDLGQFVLGAELGGLGDVKYLEGQAGLDLGRVLTYVSVGTAEFGNESSEVFGIGADMKFGKVLVGGKAFEGDAGAVAMVRVGLTF